MFQIYFRDKVPMAVTNVSEVLDHLLITEQNLINIKKTCIYICIYSLSKRYFHIKRHLLTDIP